MPSPQSIARFRLEFDNAFIKRFQHGAAEILRGDSLSEGFHVAAFEARFAQFVGTPWAVAVNSGTAALELAFQALDVAGGAVIMPTNTFFATAIAALRAGAEVILHDIEARGLGLDPDGLAERLNARVRAVCLVHIGGLISPETETVCRICAASGIPVVEDAAHAHGSSLAGRAAGRIGRVACFSFYPTKVMTTGEGGMVVTDDKALAARIRSLKNFGRDPDNPLFHLAGGMNYKLTELQGLMGCLELERLEARLQRRRNLARQYQKALRDSAFDPVAPSWQGHCSYYKQIIRTPIPADRIRTFCAEAGVDLSGEVYRVPLHRQPYLRKLGISGGKFPVAEHFCGHHVCPPLYPELEDGEVEGVCAALLAGLERID